MKYMKSCAYLMLIGILGLSSCRETSVELEKVTGSKDGENPSNYNSMGRSCSLDGKQQTMYELAERLVTLDYDGLFYEAFPVEGAMRNRAYILWREPGIPSCLEELVSDSNFSNKARFLAAEIVSSEREDYPPDTLKSQLAPIYAEAIENVPEGLGGDWLVPDGTASGQAGQNLIELGEEVVPFLIPLLSNERRVIYEGSEMSTLGHMYQYRVKDLAAFFIAKIRELDYEVYVDPSERDEEIERLRSLL